MYLDKPIDKAEDDLLSRNDFAIKLARSISSWQNKESWVIALTGEWGSGKTSVKNLVVNELKNEESPVHIIEFLPWEWASQDLITQSFFNEISGRLGKQDKNKKLNALAEKLSRYSYYLNNVQSISEPAIKLFPILAGTILLLLNNFLTKAIFNDSVEMLVSSVIAVFGLWFIFFKGLGEIIKSKLERTKYLIEKNKKSLSDLKSEITQDLSQINRPILIILDDLDRLTSNQLFTITQLVKSNTDFDNIIFLFLYSKSIVEEKLTDKNQNGTDYMEKIVQVEFAVPRIDENLIINYLDSKIGEIVNNLSVRNKANIYDDGYLSHVFHQGELSNYFNDLRSLYRFLNSFEFNLNSFIQNDFLEVNFTDLFAIEVIRLFEPRLYQGIINNKVFLIKGYQTLNTSRNQSNNREEYLLKANEFLAEYQGIQAKECLKILFPVFDSYFHNLEGYFGNEPNAIKQLRICTEQSFQNYFNQSVPERILSQSELMGYIDSLSDFDTAKSKLLHIYNSKKFESFREKIPSHFDEIKGISQINFFISFKNLAEFIRSDGFPSDSFMFYALTFNLFNNLDQQEIFQIAKEVSKNDTKGFKFLINLFYHFTKENNYYDLTNQDYLIFKNNLHKLIEDEIINNFNSLADRDNKISLLITWHDLDEQNSKTFIQNKFNNPNEFFKTLSFFVSTSTINSSASYKLFKRTKISRQNLYLFINQTDFETLLNQNSRNGNLTQNEQRLVDLYNQHQD